MSGSDNWSDKQQHFISAHLRLCADILVRVSGGETPAFRPPIPPDDATTGVNPLLLQLMRDCWDEHPALRPDFASVCSRFLQINGEKYTEH